MERRRAHEVAVLKALGFSRSQLRTLMLAQSTTIVVISLVVGVPLGIVVGRVVWATSARNLGLVTAHAFPLLALLWPVLAVVAANVLALVAAQRVTRIDPAVHLRTGRIE